MESGRGFHVPALNGVRLSREPVRDVKLCRLRVSLVRLNQCYHTQVFASSSARCKLVVLALELGGRWSAEAATFVKLPPASSRGPTISAFAFRWSALLSFAAARAFATSLLSLPLGGTANVDGESPLLSDILADSSLEPPLASRLP